LIKFEQNNNQKTRIVKLLETTIIGSIADGLTLMSTEFGGYNL